MPTQKKSPNRKARKTARGHQKSLSGKILPPLDVRSSSSLAQFKKRILSGPVTIVMVYADWCGHCHEMRPHFDAAAKTPNRSMQAISVNETMLDQVNQTINSSINKNAKSIDVEGYPSILIVDNQGNKVTDINAVHDTNVMKKVMSQPVNSTNAIKKTFDAGESEEPSVQPVQNNTAKNPLNSYVGEDKLLGSVASSIRPNRPSNLKENKNEIAPVSPSNPKNDIASQQKQGIVGGSLFGILSQSAYTLAPAAVLLATAAAVMNKRKSKKAYKKSKKASKKTMKRRRM